MDECMDPIIEIRKWAEAKGISSETGASLALGLSDKYVQGARYGRFRPTLDTATAVAEAMDQDGWWGRRTRAKREFVLALITLPRREAPENGHGQCDSEVIP
jgi:hypothetical protein